MAWFKGKAAEKPAQASAQIIELEEPDEDAPFRAAASVAARVKSIAQAEHYIRKVTADYSGEKSFETELARLGIARDVSAILKRG